MATASDNILDEYGSVVLDSNGNGHIDLRPKSTRITWQPDNADVSVATNVKEPTAVITLNGVTKLASTYTGSGDSCGLECVIRRGFIRCTWTGGDAGAKAELHLTGVIVKA